MTQEEKARAYDEALEKAKKELQTCGSTDCDAARQIYRFFPELQDLEDERIRKAIIDGFTVMKESKNCGKTFSNHNIPVTDILAWLEKQGKETSWKPSKEEMDVLYSLAYITNQYDEQKEQVITRLYQDLKREFFNGSSYENMFPTNTSTEEDVRRRSTIQVLEYARSLDTYNQYGKADIDKNIAWLEKQGEQETDEWKEGNIIRHGGILALVIRGRRVMKSNGEIFTVQYPDEWVKAAPKEIEHFLNEFEKKGEQPQGKTALEAAKEEKVDNANKVEPKFKVKYAGNEYNVFETKDIAGVTFYGIEDEPNHIDYVKAENCEIISVYAIKENGSPYPTKPAVFSEKKPKRMISAEAKECIYGSDNEQVSSEKIGKNDTLLDLLNKMPSCITVDGIDYHFVLKKTIAYMAFYEGEGDGSGKVIFWMAGEPVPLLTAMLEKLKNEGLLE